MYYEEKVIEGILHFRTSPTSNFQACTKHQLTLQIFNLKEDRKRELHALQEQKIHFSAYQWGKIQQCVTGLV